jgi:hypothetical protein
MTMRSVLIPAALILSLALAAQSSQESKPADSKAAQSQTQPNAQAAPGQGAAEQGATVPKAAGQRHFPVPKNLQILPKDISEEQLFGVMKSFATSLGWRCTNCHVGEEGKPLSTYDFASDAKKEKGRAREMIKIAHEINASMLPKLGMNHPQTVSCWTCHRGHSEPEARPAGQPGAPGEPEHHHDHADGDHDHDQK